MDDALFAALFVVILGGTAMTSIPRPHSLSKDTLFTTSALLLFGLVPVAFHGLFVSVLPDIAQSTIRTYLLGTMLTLCALQLAVAYGNIGSLSTIRFLQGEDAEAYARGTWRITSGAIAMQIVYPVLAVLFFM